MVICPGYVVICVGSPKGTGSGGVRCVVLRSSNKKYHKIDQNKQA